MADGNPLEWIDSPSICNSIIKYLTFVDIPWDNSKTDEDNLKNDKITKILYHWMGEDPYKTVFRPYLCTNTEVLGSLGLCDIPNLLVPYNSKMKLDKTACNYS